jgi:hypothetical protein
MGVILAEVFWVGVLPCAVAAAMVAARRFVLRPAAVWATSVGGAFIVGMFALAARNGWSAGFDSLIHPNEASEWLPWFVLVAIGIDLMRIYARHPAAQLSAHFSAPAAALAVMLAVAIPPRLLASSIYSTRWTDIEKLGVLVLWAVVLSLVWFLLAAGRAGGQMRVRGVLLIVAASGMALVITLGGSFAVGRFAGVVAAALAGTLLGAACFRTPGNAPNGEPADGLSGAAGGLAVALGGLILVAHYYASLPALNAALLTAAVVAAGGRLPVGWPRGRVGPIALRTALCLVPLAIALALALAAATADPYAV